MPTSTPSVRWARVPQRGIYDNMRTAVDRVGSGKARQVNARFAAMASHYLFDTEFCNPAASWEKGQIEKNVQDARRRLWAPTPAFADLAALNNWLEMRSRRAATSTAPSCRNRASVACRVEARKLVLVESEARQVREIFERLFVLRSANKLARELRQQGVLSKTGAPIDKGYLWGWLELEATE